MLRQLNSFLRSWEARLLDRRIQQSLKLHLRGEGRSDGLSLKSSSSYLELEWYARDIHPWDKSPVLHDSDARFVNQAIADTEAVLSRLYAALPHINRITIRVYEPSSDRVIMSGEVSRYAFSESPRPLSGRMWLGQLGVGFHIIDNRFQPLHQGDGKQHRLRFKPHSIENHCT